MAAVASLSLSLLAGTKKFTRGMKTARKQVAQFASSVRASAVRVAKLGAALGAVAIAGFAFATKRAMATIDTMTKLAKRIGITTEELAELEHVSVITGVGVERMRKAIEELNRRLGEAFVKGSGEAKDSLDQLNLTAADLVALGPAKAFDKIREAIGKLGTTAEQAQASYGLFGGRQGKALLNALTLSKEEFAALGKETHDLGLTFSTFSGTQVENANDAIARLVALLAGKARGTAIGLAPLIDKVATSLVDAGKKFKDFGFDATGAITKVVIGFAKVVDEINNRLIPTITNLPAIFQLSLADVSDKIIALRTLEANVLDRILPPALVAGLAGVEHVLGTAKIGTGLRELAQELRVDAEESLGKGLVAGFTNAEGEARQFFSELATEQAKRLADFSVQQKNAQDTLGLIKETAKAGRVGEFRRISRRNISIPGVSQVAGRVQKVTDLVAEAQRREQIKLARRFLEQTPPATFAP